MFLKPILGIFTLFLSVSVFAYYPCKSVPNTFQFQSRDNFYAVICPNEGKLKHLKCTVNLIKQNQNCQAVIVTYDVKQFGINCEPILKNSFQTSCKKEFTIKATNANCFSIGVLSAVPKKEKNIFNIECQ